MRKIITFLGASPARPTTYCHQDKEYSGHVFAEALRQFCDYDVMLVCVTEEAKRQNWGVLEGLDDPRIQSIDIPIGRDIAEMWQTFEIIACHIAEGDRVTFDITHGLRSLPFLVFLFAAYLKEAKNVVIDAIYYGALELGNSRSEPPIPAPVIDLSEFVEMLDWLTATRQFVDLGNGQALATLLMQKQPSKVELQHDPVARSQRDQIKNLATSIETISLALQLARPIETMEAAAKLDAALDSASESIAQRAQPFRLLADQVAFRYGQFGLNLSQDPVQGLQQQLAMVDWYVEKQQTVQAATLAREWIVSVLVLKAGMEMLDKNNRFQAEQALNQAAQGLRTKQTGGAIIQLLDGLLLKDEVAELWEQITNLRNDIAHVGMRSSAGKAAKLKQRMEKINQQLHLISAQLLLP